MVQTIIKKQYDSSKEATSPVALLPKANACHALTDPVRRTPSPPSLLQRPAAVRIKKEIDRRAHGLKPRTTPQSHEIGGIPRILLLSRGLGGITPTERPPFRSIRSSWASLESIPRSFTTRTGGARLLPPGVVGAGVDLPLGDKARDKLVAAAASPQLRLPINECAKCSVPSVTVFNIKAPLARAEQAVARKAQGGKPSRHRFDSTECAFRVRLEHAIDPHLYVVHASERASSKRRMVRTCCDYNLELT